MKDTTQTIAQIEKLVDELKAFNNINIQVDKASLNIIFDKINQIKSTIVESKADKTPIIWYDEISLESYLTNTLKVHHKIAKIWAEPYADNLQQAYAKGWEQGYNRITGSSTETYVYYPKQLKEIEVLNNNKKVEQISEAIRRYYDGTAYEVQENLIQIVESILTQ